MSQPNLTERASARQIVETLPHTLVKSLKDTPQNTTYHAEGSVFEHICMVLDEVKKLPLFFQLSARQQRILTWAALLHDIGKIKVTQKKSVDWSAKGHEPAGVPMAYQFLLKTPDLSLEDKQDILSLVKLHFLPMRMFYQAADISQYKLLATRVDLRLLGYFSWCDLHGRICRNQKEVAKLIRRFVEEIVPQVEEDIGTSAEIQACFREAGHQKKNALWASVKGNSPNLLQALLREKNELGQVRPAFSVLLPVGLGQATNIDLRQRYPALLPFTHELPAHQDDSVHIRSNHLRTSRHFISVFGKNGKQLLVQGPWFHRAYYQELNEFIRARGGAIHRLQVGTTRHFPDFARPDNPLQPQEAKHLASAYLPHPWESHTLTWLATDD